MPKVLINGEIVDLPMIDPDTGAENFPTRPPKTAADYPLKRWQFLSALKIHNKEAAVRQAIAGIPDQNARTIAEMRLDHAHEYNRDDALVEQIRAAISMTTEELDALWLEAKGYK